MAAATAAWLLVAEFDERGGWHGVGITSCAHWLAWQCGWPRSPPATRRVARALRGLPRIAAAFDAAGCLRQGAGLTRSPPRLRGGAAGVRVGDGVARAVLPAARDDDAGVAERPGSESHLDRRRGLPDPQGRSPKPATRPSTPRRREPAGTRPEQEPSRRESARRAVDRAVAERCAEDEAAAWPANARRPPHRGLGALAEARVHGPPPGDPPRREVVVHVDAACSPTTPPGRPTGRRITAQARRTLRGHAVSCSSGASLASAAAAPRHQASCCARRRLPGCPEPASNASRPPHPSSAGAELANLVLLRQRPRPANHTSPEPRVA